MQFVVCLVIAWLLGTSVATSEVPHCSELNIGVHITNFGPSMLQPPVRFVGDVNSIVVVSTYTNLWVSFDYGGAFTMQNVSKPIRVLQSANRTHIFVISDGVFSAKVSGISVPPDGQLNWEYCNISDIGNVMYLDPHPVHDNIIAAHIHPKDCLDPNATCATNLWVSIDYGVSWKLVRTYVKSFNWLPLSGTHLIVNEYIDKSGRQLPQAPTQAVYSADLFQTSENIIAENTQSVWVMDAVVGVVASNGASKVLYIAPLSNVTSWTVAKFHNETLNGSVITVLDGPEGSIFVALSLPSDPYGNLYISDVEDGEFTLSLLRIKKSNSQVYEFAKVSGMDGLYLANQIDEAGNTITLITFDRGASWHRLRPPRESNCTQGDEFCSLKLDLESTRMMPYAPSLVFGHGQADYKRQDGELDMYYSRDGAKSFKFFKNGAHFADVINHGSYVVLLPKSGLPHLEWTEDEGQTWHSCRILPSDGIESIKIINTYSDNDVPRIWLHASNSQSNYIISIDMTNVSLGLSECQGANEPNSANSDYELWTPTNLKDEYCILGRNVTYLRKKPERACHNRLEFLKEISSSICPCNLADYRCDNCYTRDVESHKCVIACDGFDGHRPPENCTGSWLETDGYLLIPGDACDLKKGIDLRPKLRQCPELPPDSQPPITPPEPSLEPEAPEPEEPPSLPVLPPYDEPVEPVPVSPPDEKPLEPAASPILPPAEEPEEPEEPATPPNEEPATPPNEEPIEPVSSPDEEPDEPATPPNEEPVEPPSSPDEEPDDPVPSSPPDEEPVEPIPSPEPEEPSQPPSPESPPEDTPVPPVVPPETDPSTPTSPDIPAPESPINDSPADTVEPPISSQSAAYIVLVVIGVLLVPVLILGTLIYLSARNMKVRSCMSRFLPAACLPEIRAYRYTRLKMETEMDEDDEIFDQHLLEEDADLIDADEERFRRW